MKFILIKNNNFQTKYYKKNLLKKMNKSDNRINKNNQISNFSKKVNNDKISPVKNKSFSSKNMYPQDSSYTKKTEPYNNTNEDVIANILKTNNINNSQIHKTETAKINNKIKFLKKNSSTSINVNNDYKEMGDFSFINISPKVKPFLYKPQKIQEFTSHAFNNFHFLDIDNAYRMIINILLDDDSLHSSNDLLKIFESIILSLKSLGEINITNKDFLVCIFFQHFSEEETFKEIFPGLNFYNSNNWIKMNTFYCSYGDVLSVNDTPINVLMFYKESATFIEVYKFFYCNVVNDLISLINIDPKEIGKSFLLVNCPNGKTYEKSANKYHKSRILSNIFRICNNRNMILIPDINYTPYGKKDYFGHLYKYNFDSDKVYVNLLWDMMCAYPIDHRYFFVNMNYKLYLALKDYYQNDIISIYANEYYHDYNLCIYLKKQFKNLTIQKIQQVKIEYSGLPSNLITFFYDFNLKRGSEYANFFDLISYFFSCQNMSFVKFLQKIVLFLKLVGFFIQFFWLGLSLLISYAVFNETFGSKDNNVDYFCSLGYAIIVILLLFIITIFVKNKPRIKQNKIYRNLKRNRDSYTILVILYIIHYAYNIFFLVCAIIAIVHVDNGKYKHVEDNDYYLFNKKYFIILLIVNLLFVILPSFLRPINITSKGFFYYIILQFINSTCYFHIPYLFTCIRNINSSKKNFESLYVTLYLLFNGLLTVMCLVFDDKRHIRVDFFFVLSSILAVLMGLKLIFLIIGICLQNRFNKKISTGQIPQYNIVNSVTSELNYNNEEKKENLQLNKDDNNITIKNTNENKNKTGFEKELSSQAHIIPNDNLLLNKSYEKYINNIESKNNNNNKYNILDLNENQNQIQLNNLNNNNIKNDLNNEYNISINQNSPEKKENELYIQNNNNKLDSNRINNSNLDEGSYPFDSANLNDENSNSIYKNEEGGGNHLLQNNGQNFALVPNDILNNENNSISNIENVNNYYYDDNL